jgi:hypothetical protein
MLGLALNEVLLQRVIKPRVPSAWCLPQTIQHLQPQDFSFLIGDDKSRRLAGVRFLLQIPIEKRRFHVHVVDLPPFLSCKRKEEAHGLHASDRSEDLIVVDPLLLQKAPHDLPCLIPLQLVHPLQGDATVTLR